MTLPGGPDNVDTTKGVFLTSAYGNGNQSIEDLTGNDEAYVKAVFKDRYLGGDSGSIWTNPTGPLGLLFSGVTGGLFSLIKEPISQLVGLLVTVLDLIPIIGPPAGDALEYLASIFGLMKTNTESAQETGEGAQSSADNANVGVAQLEAKLAAADVPGGTLFNDTFDRSGSTLGADYDQADSGSAGGTLSTDGNNAVLNPTGAGVRTSFARISGAAMLTKYQGLQLIQDGQMVSTVNSPEIWIILRCNAARTEYVIAKLKWANVEIGKVIASTYTQLATASSTNASGDRWTFKTGTTANDREFILIQNTSEVLRVTESGGTLSGMGTGYEYPGFAEVSGQQFIPPFFTTVYAPPKIQSVSAYDRLAAA